MNYPIAYDKWPKVSPLANLLISPDFSIGLRKGLFFLGGGEVICNRQYVSFTTKNELFYIFLSLKYFSGWNFYCIVLGIEGNLNNDSTVWNQMFTWDRVVNSCAALNIPGPVKLPRSLIIFSFLWKLICELQQIMMYKFSMLRFPPLAVVMNVLIMADIREWNKQISIKCVLYTCI